MTSRRPRAPIELSVAAALLLWLQGCAALPPDAGVADVHAAVTARMPPAGPVSPNAGDAASADAPLTLDAALRLALTDSPRVRATLARLGDGRAELEAARRISNPSIGYERLALDGGGGAQVTRGVALGLSDLLLWPDRRRFANDDFARLKAEVAGDLVALAGDVSAAWYTAVAAHQVALLREAMAHTEAQSAALAQRYFDAGNIARDQLARARAAAAEERISALHARAEALAARAALAQLVGVPALNERPLPDTLPAPRADGFTLAQLQALAESERLPLQAAREEVALREQGAALARRWRWLGAVEAGYDREREVDGGTIRGPSLRLALPLFDQNQAAIERADAALEAARAALALAAANDRIEVQARLAQLAGARSALATYRDALLPARRDALARTREQVNFMLVGSFEMIQARQAEYAAWQGYLEQLRDYWVLRARLRTAVGGALPDDGEPADGAAIGPGGLPLAPANDPGEARAAPRAGPQTGPQAEPQTGPQTGPTSDPHAHHGAHTP